MAGCDYQIVLSKIMVRYDGRLQSLWDWSHELGIKPRTLRDRYRRGDRLPILMRPEGIPKSMRTAQLKDPDMHEHGQKKALLTLIDSVMGD